MVDSPEQPASSAAVSHAFSERGLTLEEAVDAAEPIVLRAAVWERRRQAVYTAIYRGLRFAARPSRDHAARSVIGALAEHVGLSWRLLVVVCGGPVLLLGVALPLALVRLVNHIVLSAACRAYDVDARFVSEAVRLHTIDKLGVREALVEAARGGRATALTSLPDVFLD